MRVVWAVIRREYLQRVRSRWFVFATVGVPLLLVGAIAVPIVLATQNEAADRTIVVIDRSGDVGPWVASALTRGGYVVERASASDEERVRRRVENGQVGGALIVDRESLVAGRARLITKESPSALRQLGIRQVVVQAALERQLVGTGTDVDQVLAGGVLEIERIAGSGGGMDDPAFAAAYAGSFVLYMVILLYAVAVMRSVIEEKTSRIVEVILSSLSPWQLMLGKILGVGAVGLTQLAAWALVGGAVAALGLPALLATRPELGQLIAIAQLPGPGFLGYFLIFFPGWLLHLRGLVRCRRRHVQLGRGSPAGSIPGHDPSDRARHRARRSDREPQLHALGGAVVGSVLQSLPDVRPGGWRSGSFLAGGALDRTDGPHRGGRGVGRRADLSGGHPDDGQEANAHRTCALAAPGLTKRPARCERAGPQPGNVDRSKPTSWCSSKLRAFSIASSYVDSTMDGRGTGRLLAGVQIRGRGNR